MIRGFGVSELDWLGKSGILIKGTGPGKYTVEKFGGW